ncbi:type II toxin-antitoxin system VapC family toxin [Kribbella sp.]|uniref:type II toxin-antitoxin system VapC family toxin n=1 Tax=Kribbella sp. TaxID=1871183 RepID=UPI002D426317|nr:type II toxin-antitoxin system VapC family toxin [Kribbella sp.]HZX03542.1 type II toxin-antitoxin system VapC family toxin [Kribbella sp.]
MNKALVLDSGALIAVERRSAKVQELLRAARAREASVVVPTPVVAQVVREGGRQANLRRFLADSYLRFAGLDYPAALEIGALLGRSGTADVVDACVAICAQHLGHCPVVTSDPDDLRKLDPTLPLIVI